MDGWSYGPFCLLFFYGVRIKNTQGRMGRSRGKGLLTNVASLFAAKKRRPAHYIINSVPHFYGRICLRSLFFSRGSPYPVRYRFFAESGIYCENGNSFSLRVATFYGHQVWAQLNEGFFTRGSVCVCVRVWVCRSVLVRSTIFTVGLATD